MKPAGHTPTDRHDDETLHYVPGRPRKDSGPMLALLLFLLTLLIWLLSTGLARAQTAAASDPSIWSRITFGATVEGYYQYNWNEPYDRVIPLRAYDTRANSFGIQQAAMVVDAPPDVVKGRRAGLRIDLQFGQATEALQGSAANEPRPDAYRHVWQAYGSYVFPVGRGLQVDLGKFASNLGYETNYAKDNANFSRAYLFNFLPYYHAGLRTSLPVSEKVTLMYMLTNGIQQTEDFNNFKSNQITAVVKPGAAFTWITSYYAGREQPDGGAADGPDGWFRVFDTNGTLTVTPALTLAFDLTHVRNQLREGDPSLELFGLGAYGRYQLTKAGAIAGRYEWLNDEGLFGGVDQTLQEVTLTAEYKFSDEFLARGEFRRDFSDTAFFPSRGAARGHQNTALVGLVWWVGNKTGTW